MALYENVQQSSTKSLLPAGGTRGNARKSHSCHLIDAQCQNKNCYNV